MKYNIKIRHLGLLCFLPMALVCCTDWDDHYDEAGKHVVADKTLWEEIESRPDLSEFKEYLEKYGYKDMLNGAQMYTVFAPKGHIDTTGIGSSEMKIKKEMIENHIARFAHSANSALNNKPEVVMLNTKSINFTQTGEGYVFGDNELSDEYNIRAKNGVLHVIEGQQMFFHNIWEYLTVDSRFDNIRNYLYSFNDTILDEDKSVKGDINENGQQEYLDSVVHIYNSLLYSIGELNNEDSTYTMIVPTNEAWDEAYGRIKGYYTYPTNISRDKRDSLQRYHTQMSIVRDLVFSHTVQKSIEDSIISTTNGVFKKPFEYILPNYSNWEQAEKCSNGGIFVVENLHHNPWDSWHTPIKIEAERANALDHDKTTGALIYRRTLAETDSLYNKVSNGSYIEVMPSTTVSSPIITFNVWNTLAGSYDVKIVFLPQTRATYAGPIRNNLYDVKSESLTTKGELASKPFSNDCTNDPMKLDTVNVGTIKLARCAYGTEMIGLKIVLESYISDAEGKPLSTTYLIDCILLEPSKK